MKDSISISSRKDFFSLIHDVLYNKEDTYEKTKNFRMDNGTIGSIVLEYTFERCTLGHSKNEDAYDLYIYDINPTIHLDIEPEKKFGRFGEYHRNNERVYIEWYNKVGGKMSIVCHFNPQ